MKKEIKRTLLFIFTVVVMTAFAGLTAFADTTGGTAGEDNQVIWQLSDSGELRISGKEITYDENGWLKNSDNIKKVIIEDGTELIGQDAFRNCSNLEEICLPGSVKKIEPYAFYQTGIKELVLPEGVNAIESHAFENCAQLKQALLPASLNSIGTQAFAYCSNFEKIILTGSRKSLKSADMTFGEDVFLETNYLSALSLPETLAVADGLVFDKFGGAPGGGKEFLDITIRLKAPAAVKAALYGKTGYRTVKASWTKVSNATGYNVYYRKSTSGSYTFMGRTTGLYFTKANLASGQKYYFKVVPYKTLGGVKCEGECFKTGTVYTLKKVNTPAVCKYSKTRVRISWKNINGESGYQISRAATKTGTNIIATYKTTTGKSKVVKAAKGKKYYYKVRAYSISGGIKVYAPWSYAKAYTLK